MSQLSRKMSYALRHEVPDGIDMSPTGWVSTHALSFRLRASIEALQKEVEADEKNRFELNQSGTKIRARQGHSIPGIDPTADARPAQPPELLYHGTTLEAARAIRHAGIDRGKRHHVHLSEDRETARIVAERRRNQQTVILVVRAGEMWEAGLKFWKTDNGVWLTIAVPSRYLGEL